MNSISTGALDATKMVTHRMSLDDTEQGYDIFKRAAETGALKVVLTNGTT
jgi:alcohol dehydrogenase